VHERLRAKADVTAGKDAQVPPDRLFKLKHLTAVLNHTLRLQPVAPNGVQRIQPPTNKPAIVDRS
jgi:hypothetical protein